MAVDSRRWFYIRGLTASCQYLLLSLGVRRTYPLVSSSTSHREGVAKATMIIEVFDVEIVVAAWLRRAKSSTEYRKILNECTKKRGPEIEDFAVVRFGTCRKLNVLGR
jgi:hypothetical protein